MHKNNPWSCQEVLMTDFSLIVTNYVSLRRVKAR